MTSLIKTRRDTEHFLFGQPAKFSQNQLPTCKDVYLHFLCLRDEFIENGNLNPSQVQVIDKVASDVENVWKSASLPTISHKAVREKIQSNIVAKVKSLSKVPKERRSSACVKVQEFDKVFDICTCKCNVTASVACSCPKRKKIALLELPFLADQRGPRKMFIGGVDVKVTAKLQAAEKRKHKFEAATLREKKHLKCESTAEFNEAQSLSETDDKNEGDSEGSLFDAGNAAETETDQMRYSLPLLAAECDRFHVSNRAGAAIVNAALKDLGFITSQDQHLLIDHSKLRRERIKCRRIAVSSCNCRSTQTTVQALYFDGRKDWTLTKCKDFSGRMRFKKIREEHYVIISEPDSKYVNHFTPKTAKAKDIAKEIVDISESMISNIRVLGCDGTVCNVGRQGGVIRYVETALQTSLHWFVCQLHGNELPLRHLFQAIDGKASGPNVFEGDLGKAVAMPLSDFPVVQFKPVAGVVTQLPEDIVSDLSCDQKYLHDICIAVQHGVVPSGLANSNPGVLNHARWLTLANRLLRLYVSTINPSFSLVRLVSFIVNHYAPSWFRIKSHPACTDGSKNLFHQIQLTAKLQQEDRDIVESVISRNAFFAHPENLLICMLADENCHVRNRAIEMIMKCRRETTSKQRNTVRIFTIPQLNFEAVNFEDIINWTGTTVTEPPLTAHMSDDELTECSNQPIQLPFYPCHTQAVERTVKLVTEASAKCFGHSTRHGWIMNVLKSRKLKPSFQSKKDDRLKAT